jgi:hypothetical protein
MNKHRGSDADEYIFESADQEKMERQSSPNEHSGMNGIMGLSGNTDNTPTKVEALANEK